VGSPVGPFSLSHSDEGFHRCGWTPGLAAGDLAGTPEDASPRALRSSECGPDATKRSLVDCCGREAEPLICSFRWAIRDSNP
jgi:hypothetical protein